MKRAIIACGMLKKDLMPIIEKIDYAAEIEWLDETLHNVPKDLNLHIQDSINRHQDCDEIVLVYLLCGNALIGLNSPKTPLRFIKGDDCIYACLCQREDYMSLRTSSFFVSHGWLNTDRNVLSEYDRCVEKYGEEMAEEIWHEMYKNYKYLVFMKNQEDDDGPSPQELAEMEQMAKLSQVEIRTVEGSLDLFEKLLMLKEDSHIAVLSPGQNVSQVDCQA